MLEVCCAENFPYEAFSWVLVILFPKYEGRMTEQSTLGSKERTGL
jgi:hypothetical protein